MTDGLSPEVRQFIQQRIDSLVPLEILLLLRADPDRQWDAGEIAKALYSVREACEDHLVRLVRAELLSCTASPEMRYRYAPASPELHRLVGELSDTYQERRVAVITEIYSKPVNKVQTFADAFRLRKEN